jgi:hypothetical protein
MIRALFRWQEDSLETDRSGQTLLCILTPDSYLLTFFPALYSSANLDDKVVELRPVS